jgi:hypothetical protein
MKHAAVLFSLFLLLIASVPSNADTTLNTEAISKVIVFIYSANIHGNLDKPLGTGFLVVIPHAKDISSGDALILVTARHIFDPNWAYCSGANPDKVYLRLNLKHYDPSKDNTGVDYVPLTLTQSGQKKYFVSEDEQVDAAVIQLDESTISPDKYDFGAMPLNVFATADESKKLKIGDDIASAGLIPGISGERRNYPFFKFGNISSIPSEPFVMKCVTGLPRLNRVWFVAANLVGGNSGSPIFFAPLRGWVVPNTVTRGVLIGVQSVSLGDLGNPADVAGMTPVEDVFKIIEKAAPTNRFDLYRGDESSGPKN